MDRRIRVPKEHLAFIDRLTHSDAHPNGPFRQKADVLTFAGVYGHRKGRRSAFSETGDPIRMDVFENRGSVPVFYLLGWAVANDPSVLADTDEAIEQRSTIFEEFANGGLDLLRTELQGLDDPLEKLLLLLSQERSSTTSQVELGLVDLASLL